MAENEPRLGVVTLPIALDHAREILASFAAERDQIDWESRLSHLDARTLVLAAGMAEYTEQIHDLAPRSPAAWMAYLLGALQVLTVAVETEQARK